MDEFGRQVRPLGYTQVGTHPQGLAVMALEHRELEPVLAGDGRGGVGQVLGGGHIGRGRHQLTGQFDAVADRRRPTQLRAAIGRQSQQH